jgi:hypothetical protein
MKQIATGWAWRADDPGLGSALAEAERISRLLEGAGIDADVRCEGGVGDDGVTFPLGRCVLVEVAEADAARAFELARPV